MHCTWETQWPIHDSQHCKASSTLLSIGEAKGLVEMPPLWRENLKNRYRVSLCRVRHCHLERIQRQTDSVSFHSTRGNHEYSFRLTKLVSACRSDFGEIRHVVASAAAAVAKIADRRGRHSPQTFGPMVAHRYATACTGRAFRFHFQPFNYFFDSKNSLCCAEFFAAFDCCRNTSRRYGEDGAADLPEPDGGGTLVTGVPGRNSSLADDSFGTLAATSCLASCADCNMAMRFS